MMNKFLKLRFDLIFFYLFVFLLPFEKKHVFVANTLNLSTNYSPWGSIEIYLTDIVFGLVLLFWLGRFIINFQFPILPVGRQVSNFQFSKNKAYCVILSCFFLIAFVSVLQNGINNVELYHLVKLAEYILVFVYVVLNIDILVKLLWTIGVFLFSSLLQAVLGIFQYFSQHSFNLKIFGEVDLSPYIQNVAKIVVDGEKYIRAYGTLPHANILGGYLFVAFTLCLVTISLIIYILGLNKAKVQANQRNLNYSQMFHVEQSSLFGFLTKHSRELLAIFSLFAAIIFLGLVLTFSRSTWLAMICSLIFLGIMWGGLFFKFLHKEKCAKIWPILFLVIFMATAIFTFWPQIKAKTSQFDQYGDAAIAGRTMYNKIALKMVQKSPFFGVGYGNFVAKLPDFDQKPLLWWQKQPVHNIYLLALAETGLFGFFSFLCFLSYLLYLGIKGTINSPSIAWRMLRSGLLAIICGLLVIGLFDHYLWDIQQGALLFWLVLGLGCRCSMWNNALGRS